MKIVIVEPKSSHIHVYSAVPIPRLGSVLLGTILRNLGHEVEVFIEDMAPVDFKKVLQADLVGISLLTSTAPRSYRMANIVRAAGIPVVLGGTHCTFMPDEGLDYADYVVRGEGEETIVELLEAMKNKSGFENILGLSWKRGEEKVHNADRPFLADLDVTPIPDFTLVRGNKYRPVTTIMTGRGCPFECTFCTVPQFNGRGFRTHSVERVLEDIRVQISTRNVRYVFFADDIFNLKKKRMFEILEGMIRQKTTMRWGAQVRHEISRDEEALKLMKRAGCERVYVGFESINPRTLEVFKKHETREDVVSAVQNFHNAGLSIHGMFVVGSDEDTAETIVETRRFCQEHDIDTVQFMILTPMPGTIDLTNYEKAGREILTKDWSIYDGHHVVHIPSKMTPYDLQIGAVKAMQEFYSLSGAIDRFIRGDWFNGVLRFVGHRLTRKWFKDEDNLAYLETLKEELYEKVAELGIEKPVRPKKSVVIAASEGMNSISSCLEVFFRELGVKVIHSKDNLLAAVGEGGKTIASGSIDLSKRVYEFLESLKGKTDLVVMSGGDAEDENNVKDKVLGARKLAQSINKTIKQLPQIIHLPADVKNIHMPATLTAIGLVYTDDLDRIRRACFKALATI